MRTTCGISSPFELLFPASGQVTYVLRTHSPLNARIATSASFDLHVLSTPPAFILSQDQTLRMTSTSPKTGLGDLLSTAGYTTRRSGRPPHRNEAVTPSCLPWCYLPTTLQLLRCRTSKRDEKPMQTAFVRIGPGAGTLSRLYCLSRARRAKRLTG